MAPIPVYVRAEGRPTSDTDGDVPGTYLIELDSDLRPDQMATAALDVFHDRLCVTELDDFVFSVFDADGAPLHEPEDAGSYQLKGRGALAGKVDDVSLPAPLRHDQPKP